ncbi:MAG: hypothetical protein COU33_00825 [Candidatus Magasanikbacteria bacterium CG10_big_fil_rev_8_21_14_0_10_43_6]|uniref:Sulfotransferase domain-containing protein n=1 Tax=Candidatus Magasanikbacteria bacterium CG10_big_fil_rev_8_21_14_0_10_43_6 TaxID=1974650 RepID=A0A2M6W227_9BACT|nr:MAG: hypothetical protein COU33_00825 [Candidatus Magasanikbacteria bacterium CG10_big_fil_rev_8_21_14_0_10_43_6]
MFIHIGLPKTATTFLQKRVFPFLPNVTYMGIPYRDDRFHSRVLNIIYRDESLYSYEQEAEDLAKIVSESAHPLLMSDESLSCYRGTDLVNKAKRLKNAFPHASVIIVIRNQIDILQSMYFQYLKQHVYCSFETWIDVLYRTHKVIIDGDMATSYPKGKIKIGEYDLARLQYAHLVGVYAKAFGLERVHVFMYEQLKATPKNFFRSF